MNDLDDLLQPGDSESSPQMKESVMSAARPVLRRRRWTRRAMHLGGIVACFVAGMLTMQVGDSWQSVGASPLTLCNQGVAQIRHENSESKPSASELEWTALEEEKGQAKKYEAAGDQFLKRERDPEAALRCYQKALNSQTPPASAKGTWLMMALKYAREEE